MSRATGAVSREMRPGFEKFATSRRGSKGRSGFGLGLYSHHGVSAHGGSASRRSRGASIFSMSSRSEVNLVHGRRLAGDSLEGSDIVAARAGIVRDYRRDNMQLRLTEECRRRHRRLETTSVSVADGRTRSTCFRTTGRSGPGFSGERRRVRRRLTSAVRTDAATAVVVVRHGTALRSESREPSRRRKPVTGRPVPQSSSIRPPSGETEVVARVAMPTTPSSFHAAMGAAVVGSRAGRPRHVEDPRADHPVRASPDEFTSDREEHGKICAPRDRGPRRPRGPPHDGEIEAETDPLCPCTAPATVANSQDRAFISSGTPGPVGDVNMRPPSPPDGQSTRSPRAYEACDQVSTDRTRVRSHRSLSSLGRRTSTSRARVARAVASASRRSERRALARNSRLCLELAQAQHLVSGCTIAREISAGRVVNSSGLAGPIPRETSKTRYPGGGLRVCTQTIQSPSADSARAASICRRMVLLPGRRTKVAPQIPRAVEGLEEVVGAARRHALRSPAR